MEQPKLDYIKQISGGDIDFEKQLVKVIKAEFPQEKDTYFTGVKADNKKAIAEIVHKIKHKFSILGLEEGYECAVIYEENLKEGSYEKKQDFEKVLDAITSYLLLL